MALFEPLQIGSLHLKNRISLSALTRSRAGEERLPNDLMAEYYHQRDNAGILVSEATHISQQGIGWNNNPGIHTKEQVEAWKKVTSRVTSPFFLQLWHTGRASHTSFHPEQGLPVAPSPIKLDGEIHTPTGKQEYEVPRELTIEEIKQIVQDYKNAAINAKEAGFDGVEIHSANGYLPDQFLQSKSNKREDIYGGSFENRFRFLREIIEALIEVWGENRVAARLSPNGVYNGQGSPDYREATNYYLSELSKYPLAYVCVLDGLALGFHSLGEPYTLADARKYYSGVLMGNCGYELEAAEKAVASGTADIIAFGRAYISNPDLATRFKNNWPLSDPAPFECFYSFGPEGYADFKPYNPELAVK